MSVAALGFAPAAMAGAVVATDVAPPAFSAPPELVVIQEGRVTVDAHDAELAAVLSELGARAEFQVRISGPLGRVTASFTAVSVEQALQRLVRDHELMLIYRAPPDGSVLSKLIRADVFASTRSAARVRAASELAGRQRVRLLAEIERLAQSRNGERGIPRLVDLLGSAPDSVVRARAAVALGGLSGSLSQGALARALGDSAPDVRLQAVRALGNVDGARAIPVLGRVLLTDPDVTVRRAAAQMLGGVRDPAATSALNGAAQDADASVRSEIARALSRHGPSTSP